MKQILVLIGHVNHFFLNLSNSVETVVWTVESLIPSFLSREFVLQLRVDLKFIHLEDLEATLIVKLVAECFIHL